MPNPYGDFWREADIAGKAAESGVQAQTALSEARRKEILRRGAEGKGRLMGGLSGQGLGLSTMRGGMGSGRVESYDTGVSNSLAAEDAARAGAISDINFQRDMALMGYARAAKEAERQKKVSPFDVISTGLGLATGPIPGLIGKGLKAIF